jgi:arylformamidase
MSGSEVDRHEAPIASAAGGVGADSAHSSAAAPKAWRDLNQAALDAIYTRPYGAQNFQRVVNRMVRNSALMRERIGEPQVFSYGPSPIEKLYYYPANTSLAPIHIHVHGGGWQQRRVETILFPAEAFVNAGIGFAIYDFISVDETSGDLAPMLEQVCGGLAWLATNARKLGGDPDRLYVSGFSSGSHLAGMAMAADWGRYGFTKNPYQGVLLASGIYDLRPLRLAAPFSYIRITDETEESMSPCRQVDKLDIPVVLAYGTYESPEFNRHTHDFAAALTDAGKSVQCLVAEGYNHYEVMEMFGHPYSPLGRAAIAQVER